MIYFFILLTIIILGAIQIYEIRRLHQKIDRSLEKIEQLHQNFTKNFKELEGLKKPASRKEY